jgi:hypothetical protein
MRARMRCLAVDALEVREVGGLDAAEMPRNLMSKRLDRCAWRDLMPG